MSNCRLLIKKKHFTTSWRGHNSSGAVPCYLETDSCHKIVYTYVISESSFSVLCLIHLKYILKNSFILINVLKGKFYRLNQGQINETAFFGFSGVLQYIYQLR